MGCGHSQIPRMAGCGGHTIRRMSRTYMRWHRCQPAAGVRARGPAAYRYISGLGEAGAELRRRAASALENAAGAIAPLEANAAPRKGHGGGVCAGGLVEKKYVT